MNIEISAGRFLLSLVEVPLLALMRWRLDRLDERLKATGMKSVRISGAGKLGSRLRIYMEGLEVFYSRSMEDVELY